MRIGVSGATGLIGRALCRRLSDSGYEVTVFGRRGLDGHDFSRWDLLSDPPDPAVLRGLRAFVHLAGEPIADQRWSEKRKRLIRDSRVLGTRRLVQGLAACPQRPRVLISASAVGFYGGRGDELLDEDSPPGTGYLPRVCSSWETEAGGARELGVRVVLLRTGLVLSAQGGALGKMLIPFRLGLGGRLGSGRQYMPWIHLADEIELIRFAIETDVVEGALNAVAPAPVTNGEFSKALGAVLGRPVILPVPAAALKLALGEMAGELLLQGQRVMPKKALEFGFPFRFPVLREALKDLLC